MNEELKIIPRAVQVPAPSPRDVIAVFFRQRKLFLRLFLSVFLVIVLYGIFSPAYRAEMKILVRRGRIDPMATPTPSQAPQLSREEVTEEELNSEVEVLQDDDILRTVAQTSGLANTPSWFWNLLGESNEQHLARTVRRMIRRLDVQPAKKADLILVTYTSSDPQRAAAVLHCLASAYVERHLQVRRPSGEFDFFDRQMGLARTGLEQAEVQLMTFNKDEGVVSAAMERDNALQKLSQTDADSQQTRVSIAETAQRIRTLQAKLPSFPEHLTTQTRNTDNPQLFEKLKSRLLELRLQRTELLTKFGSSYRLVKEVEEQIAETKATIDAEEQLPLREQTVEQDPNHEWVKAELLKTQVELNALLARSSTTTVVLAGYRQAAQDLGYHAIRQQDLMQNLKTAEDQYMLYANKREEARIGDALDQGGILNVTIAEAPAVPALPVHSAALVGMFAFLLAGTVSTGTAFAADYLNPAFRTPDEVLGYLGTRVLASLPRRSS